TLGFFSVSAQMRDEFGLTAKASTYIHVVPKNPVPIAKCPPFVVSNHPIDDSEFDASGSYSPINRTIDHTRDEWQNKLTSYMNETMSNLIETVKLDVYDSAGLKSVEPGVCSIVVKPDLPPVAKLEVPAVGIRNQPVDVINRSYSPDGDQIELVEYKYKYDSNNNGFDDDAWKIISGSVLKFTFTPSKIGKYLFYTKVTEDYGKWDDTLDQDETLLLLDVVNDSPTISFDLEGKNEQPDLEPMDSYLPADILENWKLYQVNSNTLMSLKNIKWFNNGNVLAGSSGKEMENQGFMSASNSSNSYNWLFPFSNLGLGYNNLSPYRAIANVDNSKKQLLLDTEKPADRRYIDSPGKYLYVRTNESMFYV
ncbi:hypothetical protein, partial [Paenibacillus sp. HB172176]|uniref:hypothetical protein n=1 Tax=Paenibacillus sp. HB172176 TaxID=2493690 RepID=UPI00143B9E14